jgi:mono/diheme cytochrome c family protein
MRMIKPTLFASALFVVACGGSSSPREPVEPTTDKPTAAVVTNDELAARGATLYGANCAKCHGDAGQGTDKGPAVVGAGALPKDPRPGAKRQVVFSTAYDIGAWVMENMPGDNPGSLAPEEYLAILAFDLKANGVALPTEPLTVEGLKTIVIHP